MDLTKIENDMTDDEKVSLADYISKGKPGFSSVLESDIFNWFTLYMSGKTYGEIAEISNKKKDLVLYMSAKSEWYNKRLAHYQDLSENMLEKLKRTKLDSIDTLNNSISALGKYCNGKFNKFLSTNDKNIIEQMDFKIFAQYCKSVESLEKLMGEATKTKDRKPSVNINMTEGTVKQVDEDTLEIDSEDTGKMLKMLADLQNKK